MKCCGKNRETKFCPDCGRGLDQEPIYQLLAHITKTAHNYKRQLDFSVENEMSEFHRNKAKKTYKKWNSWKKALRKLIKQMKEVEE